MGISDSELKDLIVTAGLTDEAGWEAVAGYAASSHVPMSSALMEKGMVSDEQLGQLIATRVNVPFVVLSKLSIPEDVFRIVPENVARKQKAVAFARDADGVKVATANPANQAFFAFVAKKTGQRVNIYFATERDIETTLQVYKKVLQKTVDELLKEDIKRQRRRCWKTRRLPRLSMRSLMRRTRTKHRIFISSRKINIPLSASA